MNEWFLKLHPDDGQMEGGAGEYLKAQDDGPDKSQGEPVVPIHNVMRAHVFQVHALLLQKLQGLVDIFQGVDPHATACGPWLGQQGRWENQSLVKSTLPSAPPCVHPKLYSSQIQDSAVT